MVQPVNEMKNENRTSLRFAGKTQSIDIRKLERETRKILYVGFVFSVCLHTLAAALLTFNRGTERVPRPITVNLIIRPPRPRKPFLMSGKGKRTRTFHRMVNRIGKPRPAPPLKHPEAYDIPVSDDSLAYETAFRDVSALFEEPFGDTIEASPAEARSGRNTTMLSTIESEMISVEDLDYGKYKSVVLRDLLVKRNISGFVYLPVTVWGAELRPLKRPVIGLAEALKKYTGISPRLDRRTYLSSPEIFKFPFLYISTDTGFELTKREKENFAEYLKHGGFAMLDNGFPQEKHSDAEASLRQVLRDAKAALGSAAFITVIPPFHPLFYSFFDFTSGPPLGASHLPPGRFNQRRVPIDPEMHPDFFLEGLWFRSRLVAVYSDLGYGLRWAESTENSPQQKFGVNIVVYALTHEGGINRRQSPSLTAMR